MVSEDECCKCSMPYSRLAHTSLSHSLISCRQVCTGAAIALEVKRRLCPFRSCAEAAMEESSVVHSRESEALFTSVAPAVRGLQHTSRGALCVVSAPDQVQTAMSAARGVARHVHELV